MASPCAQLSSSIPPATSSCSAWRSAPYTQRHDAERAALAITDYRSAIDRVAQTSLREMIGSSMLATRLSDRKEADERLKLEIGQRTAPWASR